MDIQELDISKVISPALVNLDLQATSKLEVIEELTDLLVETGAVADKDAFIADVLYREEEGKTGLGKESLFHTGSRQVLRVHPLPLEELKTPLSGSRLMINL